MAAETHYTGDPIAHEIEQGNVYEDSRTGECYELVFEYDHAVVLAEHTASDPSHFLESRAMFEEHAGGGRYSLCRDLDGQLDPEAETEVLSDGREEVDFEAVSGIGEGTADNLRANGYMTKGDVRQASKSDLTGVRGMGEKNTDRLLDRVEP